MAETVIDVNKISKRYRLGYRAGYSTLGDLLAASARNLAKLPSRVLLRRNITERNQGDGPVIGKANNIWALRDVSFSVQDGEAIGLIGKNGSGKSTLLKILSRITDPTLGNAWLKGRIGSLLEVGIGFHPELSGRDNIFLYGAILGMHSKEISRKLDEIISFAEIEQFLDTPVKRYSSGMYLRLAFAVAAHLETEILLVDEVLAVGDLSFQKKCLGKMGSVAKEGRTVIFVSHSMASIAALCGRCIWLSKGEVAMDGPSDTVLQAYIKNSTPSADDMHEFTNENISKMRISMTTLEKGRSDSFVMGQGFRIEVTVSPAKPFRQVNIHLVLFNSMGIRVSTICTPENPGGPFDLDKPVVINVTVPANPLLPGEYFWLVRLRWQQHRQNLMEIDHAYSFSVMPRILPEAPVAYQHLHGIVHLGADIQIGRG